MYLYNPTTSQTKLAVELQPELGEYNKENYSQAGWFVVFIQTKENSNIQPRWYEDLALATPVKLSNEDAYVQQYETAVRAATYVELKEQALEYINNKRKVAESSGFVTPDGYRIRTDQKTQQTVAEAVRKIEEGVIQEPVNWLSTEGFMSLTLLQLKQIGAGIAMHVQYCFNRQKQLWDEVQAIDATSLTAKEQLFAVGVDSGWPTPAE
jgi:hypothetical protein